MISQLTPVVALIGFDRAKTEQTIPARFEQQVGRYPNRVAVQSSHQELTYNTLSLSSNQIAHVILKRCPRSQQPIAVLLGNGSTLVSTLFGVLKADQIFAPLDPSYPPARITHMLQDLHAELVITDDKHVRRVQQLAQGISPIMNIDEIDSNVSTDHPGLAISSDSMATILYTSGSTGQPKGVIHSHRNILHAVMRYTKGVHLTANDRFSLLASPSHAAGLDDIFRILLNGATALSYDIRERGLADLPGWLVQQDITVYHSIPTVFRYMLEAYRGQERFPKLRLIHLGGGMVSLREVELYKKYFSDDCILLVNLSSTETGCYRQFLINKATPITGNTVPVGYELEDQKVLLLDDENAQVGFDRVGEIAIKSRYLAVGYWRKPDLTQSAFMSSPTEPGERIYRTGDLGRMRSDGCLEYLGRKDLQVKVRGHRVELAEIEATLLAIDTLGLRDAVVIAQDDLFSEKRLIAYVVPNPQFKPTTQELQSLLSERLPNYMVPPVFVVMDKMPLTPNGKVDRPALPVPGSLALDTDGSFLAPRDDLERELAVIWETLLGVRPIGIRSNFFDLGGNSLLAFLMFAQIEQALGKRLNIRILLQAATIEHLANTIRQGDFPMIESTLVPIQTSGTRLPLFCVHGLDGLATCYRALAQYLGPGQPLYALQSPGLDGKEPALRSIEEMAARYVRDVRTLQPTGPYLLSGLSMGGYIAFEMAQQLHAQGQAVALLAMVDTPVFQSPHHLEALTATRRLEFRAREWGTRVRFHIAQLNTLPPRQKLAYLKERIPQKLAYLKRRITRRIRGDGEHDIPLRCQAEVNAGLPPWIQTFIAGFPPDVQAVVATNYFASKQYVPRRYPGKIVLFKSKGRKRTYYGWQELAKEGVEVYLMPGTHDDILEEPHVQFLAARLKASLNKANESHRKSDEST